jgi:hypothetical protein
VAETQPTIIDVQCAFEKFRVKGSKIVPPFCLLSFLAPAVGAGNLLFRST